MLSRDELTRLARLLNHLHLCTGVKFALMDDQGREVYTSSDRAPFCRAIMSEGSEKCIACDRAHVAEVLRTGKPCRYLCHAGLYEVVSPIQSDDGIIGYIQFGQIYNQDYADLLRERMAEYSNVLDAKALQEALSVLKPMDSAVINAAAMLIQTCITYLLTKKIVLLDKNNFVDELMLYIENNIRSEITVTGLCNYFGISRTSFYDLSSQCLDCSVMQYIKRIRVEKAKKLLQETDLSITEISEQIGFMDYNYFLRVFKKETGISCKEFRQVP